MSGLDVLAAAFTVAALVQIDRRGFLQGAIARPLIAAFAVSMWLGDGSAAVLVGVPLTLLWLLEIEVGVHPSEHAVAGGAGITAAAIYAGGGTASPGTAALALILLPATASLGRWAEARIDAAHTQLHAMAARRVDSGRDPLPAHLVGLLLPSAGAGLLAAGTALLGGMGVGALWAAVPQLESSAVAPMALLFGGAAAGSTVVARSRFPEATLVGGAATAMALGLFLALQILSTAEGMGGGP